MTLPEPGASTREFAEAYIDMGFSVIPIEPGGKRPPEVEPERRYQWEKHQHQRATVDDVDRWLARCPNLNLGIVTGPISGLLVVDVDGTDGRNALLESKLPLPGSLLQKTPHGWHCLYRYPSDVTVRNAAGIVPKVDIRAEGGYIVVAPSTLPDGAYAWQGAERITGLADAPRWVVSGRIEQRDIHERLDTASILAGVPEGRRDQELFRLASKLRHADVPLEMAESLVLEAAGNCTPPFPIRQAREKVLSAYGRYKASVSVGTDDAGTRVEIEAKDRVRINLATASGPAELLFADMEKFGRELSTEMSVRLLMPGMPAEEYTQRVNLLSMSAREDCRRELTALFGKEPNWSAVLSRAAALAKDAYLRIDRSVRACDIAAPDTVEDLIENLLPDDGITTMFGPGGGHKTWMLGTVEDAISTGSTLAGLRAQKRNVLHVDCGETGATKYKMRLRRLVAAAGRDVDDVDNIHYLAAEGIPLIDLVDSIRRLVDRHNIGFIGADHAAALCLGKVEESDAAKSIGRAQAKIGLPMLLIAHITGEASLEPSQVRRPFGSIFWHNIARQTWYVQSEQKKASSVANVGLFNKKTNDGIPPDDIGLTITFDDPSGPVRVARGDLRTPKLVEARGLEYVLYQALDSHMTTRDLAEATSKSEPEVRKTLNAHPDLFRVTGSVAASRGQNRNLWERAS